MKIIYLLALVGIILISCEEKETPLYFTEAIESNRFYEEDIFPEANNDMYGLWKLYDITGGLSGTGHENDFDYLEMKSKGIYGLVRDEALFEYGKIELDTFDLSQKEVLQVKFLSEFPSAFIPYFNPMQKYIYFSGKDTLTLVSPCCDNYNYHFKRVR